MELNPVDAKYFDRIKEFGSFFASQHINPINSEEQRQKFLSGEIDSPHFLYEKTLDFDRHEKELNRLLHDITTDSNAEQVMVKAYSDKIEEQLEIINLLEACQDGHDYIFSNLSRKIYGSPTLKGANASMNYIAKLIENGLKSQDEIKKKTALELLIALQGMLLYAQHLNLPSGLSGEISQDPTNEDEYLDAEMIKFSFESELHIHHIKNWQCLIVDKINKSIQINQTDRQILIPNERKVSQRRLDELMVHEIGTHVIRRENGEKCCLQLLGIGLAGYLNAEEGLAIMQTQKYFKEFFVSQDALILHFASALAEGLDGQKRYFRNIFDIIRKVAILLEEKNLDDYAWTKTKRIFRGTTGQTANAYYRGDSMYIEGNCRLWEMINKYPESHKYFFLGKYDPTKKEHREIAEHFCNVKII